MDSLPSPLPTALRELIRYVRPPWLRRWVREGYGWVQPRFSPVARAALPPHLTAEYLELTRGAIDFNRPGIPIVASLPSVHIAETYGKAHHGRPGTVAAITEWADQHDVPLVDLKAAVGEEVMSGRGNPDGIHWNFEAHHAVAELMLKALAQAGVATMQSAQPIRPRPAWRRCSAMRRASAGVAADNPRLAHPRAERAFLTNCAASGGYARSRCTFCSTTPICATGWTRSRTTSTITDTRPPPPRRRLSGRCVPPCAGGQRRRRGRGGAPVGGAVRNFRAAHATAAEMDSAVRVLDSKSAAMNTGFVALAAARAAADGANLDTVANAAAAAVSRNHGFIVVHQLDNLRRSGRIGGAGAWLGTKLSLKPLLRMEDGKLVLAQRVRTAGKATATMIDRVCEVIGGRPASIAVHHVANPDGARDVVTALGERLPGCETPIVTELGPVLALHVGAGALGVCVEVAGDTDPQATA